MKNDNPLHGLLPLGAMAAHLGVQPRDLRAEAEAGRLPHVRVGDKGILFDPHRVFAVLEERARDDSAPAVESRGAK